MNWRDFCKPVSLGLVTEGYALENRRRRAEGASVAEVPVGRMAGFGGASVWAARS